MKPFPEFNPHPLFEDYVRSETRRQFLRRGASFLGTAALAALAPEMLLAGDKKSAAPVIIIVVAVAAIALLAACCVVPVGIMLLGRWQYNHAQPPTTEVFQEQMPDARQLSTPPAEESPY